MPWQRITPAPYLRRALPPEPAPRDRWWRRDALLAAGDALAAGELTAGEHRTFTTLLVVSSDRGDAVWHSQATLAGRAGWRSDRTVRRHLAALEAKGWVERGHRWRRCRQTGTVVAMSNLTRPVLPEQHEAARKARKTAARQRPASTVSQSSAAATALPVVLAEPPPRPDVHTDVGRRLAERALRRARDRAGPP